ncbi:hypothetical protein ES703_91611 [subsurface metagenome]
MTKIELKITINSNIISRPIISDIPIIVLKSINFKKTNIIEIIETKKMKQLILEWMKKRILLNFSLISLIYLIHIKANLN